MEEKVFGRPKDNEKYEIREPFANLVKEDKIEGWEGSAIFWSVKVGLGNARDWLPTPDLVIVRSTEGRIGIVECKRAKSGQAKHGMFEQVLLYCELVLHLKEAFVDRLKKAKRQHVPAYIDEHRLFEALLKNLRNELPSVIPIVVVDRWGSRQNRTAKFTLRLLNKCLESIGRQKIQVWAVGGKKPERVDRYYT
jgi:hypothetical protein